MLWIDDDFVTVNDLLSLDPEVQEIADELSLALTGPTGLIRRGKEDAQANISRFMSFANLAPTDLTLRNFNLPITAPSLRYNYAGFAQLVVTAEDWYNWGPLKKYVVALAFRKFYRAAVTKKADRYQDRFDANEDEIKINYWPNFKRRGLPLCMNPLDAPGAIMNRCGLFTASNVTAVAGAGTVTGAYSVAVTWVGSNYKTPTTKNNGESFRSAVITVELTPGNVARVSISGLTPPNGQQPLFTMADCRYSPGTAVGWNVWACVNSSPSLDNPVMFRQNVSVLPLSQTTFSFPADPILTGEQNDLGQYQDITLDMKSELVRS